MKVIEQEYDPAIPTDKIREHEDNPRRGDDNAVRESMAKSGFFGAILVQKSTNRIIAGNTRYRVLTSQGVTTVPGFWVDCDDDTATRILLADNRTSDLAFYDDQELFALLQTLMESEAGLAGTGYDRAAYELLLQSIEADSIVGGIRHGELPEERLDAFNDLDIRSIILPYEFATYEVVANGMSQLRAHFGFENNADLVERLVTDAMAELESVPAT